MRCSISTNCLASLPRCYWVTCLLYMMTSRSCHTGIGMLPCSAVWSIARSSNMSSAFPSLIQPCVRQNQATSLLETCQLASWLVYAAERWCRAPQISTRLTTCVTAGASSIRGSRAARSAPGLHVSSVVRAHNLLVLGGGVV